MDSGTLGFLNTLAEAERAGGRVLHDLEQLTESFEIKELFKKVGHDEGYYAGQIAAHVRRLGGEPSTDTGDFVEKVRQVADLKGKLELLNRGQRWVIRKIEEYLPSADDAQLGAFLKVMATGHHLNIKLVDDLISGPGL